MKDNKKTTIKSEDITSAKEVISKDVERLKENITNFPHELQDIIMQAKERVTKKKTFRSIYPYQGKVGGRSEHSTESNITAPEAPEEIPEGLKPRR